MSRLCCGDIHNLTDIFSTSCELADRVSYKVDSRLFLEMQRLKGKMPLPARASSFFVGCCQAKRPRDPIHGWAQPGAFIVIFFLCLVPEQLRRSSDSSYFLSPNGPALPHVFCYSFVRPSIEEGEQRQTRNANSVRSIARPSTCPENNENGKYN
jgi:hypothetical protein